MRKPLLTFFFALISSGAFAQYYGNGQSPFSYSIIGGSALAFFKVKSSAASVISNGPEAVACAGVGIDYKFNDFFSISPGLFLSGKGGQTEGLYGSYGEDIAVEYQLYYIEESLNFIGHIPVDYTANIFFGAGPYFANGIFALTKVTDGGTVSNPSARFGKNGDFKSNDFGVTSLIGFETEKGYTISLSFDLGLSDIHQINPDNADNDQFKNRSLYLSIGRRF